MSLKKNIAYSGFLTASLYIFQFLTYPYVARVLGVANIGICNYVQSLVQFFCLFSMMGINTLGVREIAKCNGNKDKLCNTYTRLLCLNVLFTIAVVLVYVICIESIPDLHPYRQLLYISLCQLVFGTFTIEWFFKGIEEFKYITIRTLIVRLAYVVSVFVFIRDKDDVNKYWTLCCLMFVATGVINLNYSRKFVKITIIKFGTIFKYLKPFVFLGTQLILTSFYTTFNKIFLGYTCGDTEVGYYSTATKIQGIILSLYTSFTVVMMPRISSLVESNDTEKAMAMIKKSIELLFAFAFPCVYFFEYYADIIVLLISGAGYEGAIMPMRLVMPLLIIIGLEQIFIVQILIPFRADKQVFINSLIGAIVGIILNFALVSTFQCIGSASVWSISEITVLCSAYYFIKQKFPQFSVLRLFVKYSLAFAVLIAIFFAISFLSIEARYKAIFGLFATLLYSHFALLYIFKNDAYVTVVKMITLKWGNIYGNKQ